MKIVCWRESSSVARSRALAYLTQVALKLMEVKDVQERLAALEGAMGPRLLAQRRRRR